MEQWVFVKLTKYQKNNNEMPLTTLNTRLRCMPNKCNTGRADIFYLLINIFKECGRKDITATFG